MCGYYMEEKDANVQLTLSDLPLGFSPLTSVVVVSSLRAHAGTAVRLIASADTSALTWHKTVLSPHGKPVRHTVRYGLGVARRAGCNYGQFGRFVLANVQCLCRRQLLCTTTHASRLL